MATVRELQARFIAQATNFKKSIEEVRKDMIGLGTSTERVAEDMSESFDETQKDVSGSSEKMKKNVNQDMNQISNESQSTNEEVRKDFNRTKNDVSDNADKTKRSWVEGFNKIEKKAKTTAKDMEKRFKNFGKSMRDMSGKLGAVFSIGGTGVGAFAVQAQSEISGAQRLLRNSVNMTEEELNNLENDFNEVFQAGYGQNAEEVARAMARIQQNIQGVNQGEELQGLTKDIMNLAEVTGSDINEITRGVSAMTEQFGLDYTEAMDLFARGAQEGLNMSDEMFDNIAEFGPQIADMGYSAEEYFTMLANGAQNGAYNLDYINNIVPEFETRMVEGGNAIDDALGSMTEETQEMWKSFQAGEVTTKEMFDTVIGELEGMDDAVKREQIGIALMGTQWEDMGAEAVLALNDTSEAMQGAEGSMGEITESMDEAFGREMQATLRELREALMPIGLIIMDVIRDAIPYIQRFSDWLRELSPQGQKVVTVLGLIVSALGPVITFLGFFISGLGSVIGAIQKARKFLTIIRTALLALSGPVGIVIAIVTLLAIAIYKNWDSVKEWTVNTFNFVMEWLKEQWNNLHFFFTEIIPAIVRFIIDWFISLKDRAIETVSNLFWAIVNFWKDLYTDSVTRVTTFVDDLVTAFINFKDNVVDTAKDIYEGFTDYLNDIIEFAKELPGKIGDGIREFAGDVMGGINYLINRMASGLGKGVNGVIGGINWVLDKIGVYYDIPYWTVPQYAKGTDGHQGGPAIVGDGKGSNAGRELISTPDGEVFLSPPKETVVNLPEGSQVIPAKITRALLNPIPRYANGMWSGIKNFGTAMYGKIKTGAKKLTDIALNVVEYAKNPSAILDLALRTLGVYSPSDGGLVGSLARGGFNRIKNGAVGYVRRRLTSIKKDLGLESYARGGIVNSQQLAWVADGGWAESIISHDPSQRTRQEQIWRETGERLGFDSNNDEAIGLLRRIALAVESGMDLDVIMDERAVARILEPHMTREQSRNKSVRNRFEG